MTDRVLAELRREDQAMELTEKQRRFALEYTVDLSATRAAIRAGYSKRSAAAIGHENLRKPEIAARISERVEGAERAGQGRRG